MAIAVREYNETIKKEALNPDIIAIEKRASNRFFAWLNYCNWFYITTHWKHPDPVQTEIFPEDLPF